MAAEKTTKKASVKKADKTLLEQLLDKRSDLMDAKKANRAGELVNPRVIRQYRKDIARLLTAIRTEKLKESK